MTSCQGTQPIRRRLTPKTWDKLMRSPAPGHKPTCDLPGTTVGHFESFVWQALHALRQSCIPSLGASIRRPPTLLSSVAFLSGGVGRRFALTQRFRTPGLPALVPPTYTQVREAGASLNSEMIPTCTSSAPARPCAVAKTWPWKRCHFPFLLTSSWPVIKAVSVPLIQAGCLLWLMHFSSFMCVFWVFFFFGCTVWLVGSYFSNQGLNLSPWLGKHRVLTTRSPGDSHISALDTTIEPLCAALPHPGLGSHPPLSLQSFLLFAPCTSFLILLKPLFFTFLM